MTEKPPIRVSLFVTCLVDQLFPEVGEAVVEVLCDVKGVEVDFPQDQTCCGQPPLQLRLPAGRHPARETGPQELRP